jgi:hypothetical protein
MKLTPTIATTITLACGVALAGCGAYVPNADTVQRHQQEQLSKEAAAQTGMPAVVSFSRRKQLKLIIELRDKANLPTFSYVRTQGTGELKLLCKSIGFPIPDSAQYTNPQKIETVRGEPVTLPQADPDGIFSPPSSDATWVICVNPETGDPSPTYEENRVTTSLYPLSR